jgi:hypothetical protein
VEVVVPAGAGGASDQMARTIQGIVIKHQLMKQPMLILNMGGASGAEGIMDVKGAKGNPHKLMVAFSAIYTLPVAVNLPFNWRDLNPVAMIALDEFLLWVNSETNYMTPKDYMAAVKAAAPGTFKMGGTGSKREDHIITVGSSMITIFAWKAVARAMATACRCPPDRFSTLSRTDRISILSRSSRLREACSICFSSSKRNPRPSTGCANSRPKKMLEQMSRLPTSAKS